MTFIRNHSLPKSTSTWKSLNLQSTFWLISLKFIIFHILPSNIVLFVQKQYKKNANLKFEESIHFKPVLRPILGLQIFTTFFTYMYVFNAKKSIYKSTKISEKTVDPKLDIWSNIQSTNYKLLTPPPPNLGHLILVLPIVLTSSGPTKGNLIRIRIWNSLGHVSQMLPLFFNGFPSENQI